MRWMLLIVSITIFLVSQAGAQTPQGTGAPSLIMGYRPDTSAWQGLKLDTSSNLNTADFNGAAFQGVVVITPGTATAAQRSLGYICTSAGTITLTLADSSTITLPITTASGTFQSLPFAVTNIALGGGAAGTFWNLK